MDISYQSPNLVALSSTEFRVIEIFDQRQANVVKVLDFDKGTTGIFHGVYYRLGFDQDQRYWNLLSCVRWGLDGRTLAASMSFVTQKYLHSGYSYSLVENYNSGKAKVFDFSTGKSMTIQNIRKHLFL